MANIMDHGLQGKAIRFDFLHLKSF